MKKTAQKKEKHPVYRLILAALWLLLALGAALLVMGLGQGAGNQGAMDFPIVVS